MTPQKVLGSGFFCHAIGLGFAFYIPSIAIAFLIVGTISVILAVGFHLIQTKQNSVDNLAEEMRTTFGEINLKLAEEMRTTFGEINLKLAGFRDTLNFLQKDYTSLQVELDALDLDQLKKFEGRLATLEQMGQIRNIRSGFQVPVGPSLKSE